MNLAENRPPAYVEHAGTIRVSGFSRPGSLAAQLRAAIDRHEPIIDLLYLGANAGHQAVKGLAVLAFQMEQTRVDVTPLFLPLRVAIKVSANGQLVEKDAMVLRVCLMSLPVN